MGAGISFPKDSVVLPFPKDYFAELPSSPGGKHRLIPYTGEGNLKVPAGTEVVLPVFDAAAQP